MKYKILKKRQSAFEKKKVKVEKNKLWFCDKCNILYGEGETILKNMHNEFCPIHKDRSMSWGVMDYWNANYELEVMKGKVLE